MKTLKEINNHNRDHRIDFNDENTIIKQNCTIKYCHIGKNNIIQDQLNRKIKHEYYTGKLNNKFNQN